MKQLATWKLIVFGLIVFAFGSLIMLGRMRSKLYEPIVDECVKSGKRFHCMHGMCHCH